MQLMNGATGYGVVAQLFHWAVVALIITQFYLANKAAELPLGPAKIATLATHKSFGMTLFGRCVASHLAMVQPVPSIPP